MRNSGSGQAAEEGSARVIAFLDDALGSSAPTTVTPMVGGGSCEVFAIERGDARWVLRRPPAKASSSTAHDVLREFRILSAIADHGVRVPRPIVACDDPEVFGAPFFVMERIDGVPVRTSIPADWTRQPEAQVRAFTELVDALVEIHAVDWRAVGLADLGHPEDFLTRQVSRWLSQLDSYGGRDLPVARELAGWLEAERPAGREPTLFHGDYKMDNVLYAPTSPPELLAVVDWEMSSIGDPLVDLAWAMIFHPSPGNVRALGCRGDHAFDTALVPSVPSLLERYAQRSGRDLDGYAWYEVFSRWKLAIVLEGSHVKWLRGQSTNPMHEWFGPSAEGLLAEAREMVR